MTEEGYAEKLRLLREASQLPIDRWRATQVLAWLEVALGMPQYSARCAENVKSGKVLLELNDVELEAGLGLAHPMHRKKLRLAIEEQRRPELVRYPLITQLGHTWVATEWLPDIGLPQYAETFVQSLVDARMLDTLSKKELEKFLGVTRKFHQASIVHGNKTLIKDRLSLEEGFSFFLNISPDFPRLLPNFKCFFYPARHSRVAHREVRQTDAGHAPRAIRVGGHGPNCVDEPALHPLGAIHRPGRVCGQPEGCVCHIDGSLIAPFSAAITGFPSC